MKLIEKIKGLFKEKTKVPNPVEPSINDIDEFITSSINHTNETLKKRASLVYNEIEEILNKIDQDLLILESVNLADRKTIDKLKQITEIGKEELTSSIKGLLISLIKKREKEKTKEELTNTINEIENTANKYKK